MLQTIKFAKGRRSAEKCPKVVVLISIYPYLEPGLLEELERRVVDAESKFRAAELDQKLKRLEEAKQRQVNFKRRVLVV